jgi:hypothetical protein
MRDEPMEIAQQTKLVTAQSKVFTRALSHLDIENSLKALGLFCGVGLTVTLVMASI